MVAKAKKPVKKKGGKRTTAKKKLWIWKFMIGADPVPDKEHPEEMQWSDCMAIAVATTPEGAMEIIHRVSAGEGVDARWLSVAKMIRLPFKAGTFIMMRW